MKPMIFIFLPVFNEQETIGVLLYRIGEIMRKLRLEYEVLVILDGCTDDSPEVVAPYLNIMPLRVVHYDQRAGYGKSLLAAIKRVTRQSQNPKRDFFIVLDADFSYDPSYLQEMSSRIERNVDLYCGNRFAGAEARPGFRQTFMQFAARAILRLRGVKLKPGLDLLTTFCGCRVNLLRQYFHRLQVLERMGPEVPPSACALTFLLLLYREAKVIDQIPLTDKKVRQRGSRLSLWAVIRFLLFSKVFLIPADEVQNIPAIPARNTRRTRRKRYSNKPHTDSSKLKEG